MEERYNQAYDGIQNTNCYQEIIIFTKNGDTLSKNDVSLILTPFRGSLSNTHNGVNYWINLQCV